MWERKSAQWDAMHCSALRFSTGRVYEHMEKGIPHRTNRDAYTDDVPAYTAQACLALCRLSVQYISKVSPVLQGSQLFSNVIHKSI